MHNTISGATSTNKFFIGIDLHSTNAVVCIKINQLNKNGQIAGKKIWQGRISIMDNSDRLIQILEPYCNNTNHIAVVESTYNWYFLADAFENRGWKLYIADPSTVSQANLKSSDDYTDAEYLAERLRTNSLKHYEPLNKNTRAVRDQCRFRMDLMQRRASCKIKLVNLYRNHLSTKISADNLFKRIEAHLTETFLIAQDLFKEFTNENTRREVAMELEQIALLNRQIQELDERIRADCKENELAALCRTIPGCGPVLSSIVSSEIGKIERFATAGNFVSYCRLCPTSKLSNGKSKGLGNAKNGNAYLSWALTEIATLCVRFCPQCKRVYDRYINRSGLRVKAIRTVAAKIARVLFHILKNKQSFNAARCFA